MVAGRAARIIQLTVRLLNSHGLTGRRNPRTALDGNQLMHRWKSYAHRTKQRAFQFGGLSFIRSSGDIMPHYKSCRGGRSAAIKGG